MKFSVKAQFLSKILALALIVGLPVAIFAAKLKVTGDSFTGEKIITYEFSHKFYEGKDLIAEKDDCVYQRAVKNNAGKTVVQFSFITKLKPDMIQGWVATAKKLSPKALVQIDGKVFDMNMEKFEGLEHTDKTTKATISESVHSTEDKAVYDVEKKTTSYTTIQFKPTLTFTKEMEDAMKQAKSVKIRIYADDKPVTLEVKPKDLEKLVELFNMQ